jgi:hypothetical protein
MNTLEDLDVLTANAPIFCGNKAGFNIVDNHNIGDRSLPIDVTYHLGCGNVESG